jgi:hypothetical protein
MMKNEKLGHTSTLFLNVLLVVLTDFKWGVDQLNFTGKSCMPCGSPRNSSIFT